MVRLLKGFVLRVSWAGGQLTCSVVAKKLILWMRRTFSASMSWTRRTAVNSLRILTCFGEPGSESPYQNGLVLRR